MDERYRNEKSTLGGGVGRALTPMAEQAQCATDRAYQAPLRERVENRLRQTSERVEDLLRIRQMLTEHPEFEQFLELQTLINRQSL